MHGGKTPSGIASPQFKTGRYSKYLPGRLLERYCEADQDAELFNLRDEIALVDARLADLLCRVNTGESGYYWKRAQEALDKFGEARSKGDVELMRRRFGELEEIIQSGGNDYSAWEEVGKLIDRRQRLVESERRRTVELHQMISVQQAILLINSLADVVKVHVKDQSILSAISSDLARIVNRPTLDSNQAA